MKASLILPLYFFLLNAAAQFSATAQGNNRIGENRFMKINGIEQWVTIKGDKSMPIILFIHGGPGNPMSPFADAIYGTWEKDFILVQWDQRGSGRTFGRYAPEELTPEFLQSNPLTVEQMTSDGIELAQYLLRYLNKQKLILFGTSWGSVLAVKMAMKKPELFYAYVGHSQVVDPKAAELNAYLKVYEIAKNEKDQKSLDLLNAIGKPPYDTAKNTGQLNRIIQRYQQKNSIAPPASWFKLSAEYDNEKDNRHRFDGDDYSFVNYVGDKRLRIPSISARIDFMNDGLNFKMPVYLIQGEGDLVTPKTLTKAYYDKLQAPEKKLILVPKADHGFNQAVIDALYEIMKKIADRKPQDQQ